MSVTTGDLGQLDLFEGCPNNELDVVARAVTITRRVPEGEVICREDELADRWWIVAEGQADATMQGLYVATIGPGETIGETALLDGKPRTATVTATTEMVIHEVDGVGFLAALVEAPNVALGLLRQFANRLRAANLRPLSSTRAVTAVTAKPKAAAPIPAPTELDPSAPGYFEDPYPYLTALREAAPVHWSDALNSFVVTRYEDVHRLIRNRALLGSVPTQDAESTLTGQPSAAAKRRRMDKSMIRRDGDDHLRLRRLVSKVFTPKAISAWKPAADEIVERLLDEAAEKEKIDVISDFAMGLPVEIITRMLGLPRGDVGQLRQWSNILTRGLDPGLSPEEDEAVTQAGRGMFAYLDEFIPEKKAHPGDDILTHLIQVEAEGDRLETDEIQAQVILLYIAGHETTANLLGNTVTHLFEARDQMELLRRDPSLDANAVEEALRFDSPAQFTRRVNREPVTVGDTVIPAGSLITLSLGSANRDPRKWGPTADVLDLARPGANEHVSFGAGAHFCLGNALARLEAQAGLPKLIRRFPRMEPAYSVPSWMHRMTLRGVDTLPVTLH
jgi:cytochrome P450